MPKELMPIIDKPLIQYAVEEEIAAGIDTLIFVTGRNKRAIEDHFDHNKELEIALRARGKDDQAEMVKNILPGVCGMYLSTSARTVGSRSCRALCRTRCWQRTFCCTARR